jgi:adenylate cyclase, class 2
MSDIEYEAKFYFLPSKAELREKLLSVGATLIHSEQIYRRAIFEVNKGNKINGNYARVRDEGHQITMSIKTHASHGENMDLQKEIRLVIDSFEIGCKFLSDLNMYQKSYQETKRELWELDGAEITIDTWPWLDTYSEVEATSEAEVWRIAKLLGIDQLRSTVAGVYYLYLQKYHTTKDEINYYPQITFDDACPWPKRRSKQYID